MERFTDYREPLFRAQKQNQEETIMARKTLKERIDESLLEKQEAEKRYNLLLSQFNEQEEKAKNRRIAERGKVIESAIPEVAALTKQQFGTFIEKVLLTPHTRRILAELNAEGEAPTTPTGGDNKPQNGNNTAPKPTEAAAQANLAPTQKPTGAAHSGGGSGNGNGGNVTKPTS